MQCVAAAGFLHFTVDQNLADGNFRGFDNYLQMSQEGLRRRVATELTPAGRDANARFVDTPTSRAYMATRSGLDILKLRLSEERATEIVSDKEFEEKGRRFRLIEASAVLRPSQDGKLVENACGRTPAEISHKSRILLEWDAYSSVWRVKASDMALADQDFKTDAVNRYLASQ